MASSRPINILLISREYTFLNFISNRLKKYGYSPQEAVNGEEALEWAINKDFDLAVIDCVIPGMDGAELFNKLKDLQPCLQAVMLCDQSIDSNEFQAKCDVAPYEFMNKPCDFNSLLQNITAAYQRKMELQDCGREESLELSDINSGIKGFLQKLRKWYSLPLET